MKNLRMYGLVIVLVLGLLAVGGTTLAENESAEVKAAPEATQELNAPQQDAAPMSIQLDFDQILNNWPGECPTGVPGCFQDKQCDNYCGHPGWGWCAPSLCCGCAG